INRVRGLNGSASENQYPTHFAWNFMNGGNGWRGVSYFHTYEILQKCGTPSVETYGGMSAGGDSRWMSGFDKYYLAMQNRVKDVYNIDVSNPEGLLTLKHWLHDHLDGSEYGGVANFYAQSPYGERILAEGTPEEGKHIMINWGPIATHAMTIVGYNDSIRYDYNGDGKYTNNIDINNDEVVDMKDWEYGALLFANSYDTIWDDDGYCYMMYRTLACDYGQGGLWNESVNVLNVYENYEPTLTMRLRFKYNSRENIKIQVGVNPDSQKNIPLYTMDYPIIDFQGESQPMQGFWDTDTTDFELMEIELDVSKLLSFVDPNAPAKYFVELVENDESFTGNGEVLYFSLVDRTGDIREIVCDQVPKIITNNWKTTLSVVSNITADKPEIITDELPPFTIGQNYVTSLEALGGQPDYSWSRQYEYYVKPLSNEFPDIGGEKVIFSNMDEANKTFELPFPFPFYGDTLNEITVVLDGYVAFGETDLSYPYYFGESTMLQNRKVIAPFMADLWLDPILANNGVWVESNTEYFGVLWNTSYDYHNQMYASNFKFALKLFPDGRIETYYDDLRLPPYLMWASGVSNGDDINYTINPFIDNQRDPSEKAFIYESSNLPGTIKINNSGEIIASDLRDDVIYNITARVKDEANISDVKTFHLSSGLIYDYTVSAGDDSNIDFEETVSIRFTFKNNSNSNYKNINCEFSIEDDYFTIVKDGLNIGDLGAGETKVFDSAFVFKVSNSIIDNYNFDVNANMVSENNEWQSNISLKVNAPYFLISETDIIDNDNGMFDAGESVSLKFVIQNIGHMDANNLEFYYNPNSEYVTVIDPVQNISVIGAGSSLEISFNVKSDFNTPYGTIVPAELIIRLKANDLQQLLVPINVGRVPVLLLSLADDSTSVLKFIEEFDNLKITYDKLDYCPYDMSAYQSVFVCLGGIYQNHQLSLSEASLLNNYINEGGKIYMEGINTWINDEQYDLHEKFDVICNNTMNYFEIKSFTGVQGTPTNGIELTYHNDELNFINYYLSAEGSSFPFLNYYSGDTICVVANETSKYKTIASPVMFGRMQAVNDMENTSKYVKAIADFFGLDIQYLGVDENISEHNPLNVQVFPNPSQGRFTISTNLIGKNAELCIFDLKGLLIAKKHIRDIETDGIYYWEPGNSKTNTMPPGLYIVNVKSGNFSSSCKLIVR
ncbi:MAG: hypothetical protein C0598_01530, partial [Marinilabiliales bacterium]